MATSFQVPVLVVALANERSQDGYLRGLSLELKVILEIMRSIDLRDLVEIVILPAATARAIADVFQDERYKGRIRIFHYAGHADEDELWLEDASGGNESFSSLGLAKFLALRKEIQLVFLNACATQKHADYLIEAGVPAIIVTERKIADSQALLFAERFYKGLANGARIDEAFQEAEAFLLGSVKNVQKELSRSLIWRTKNTTEQKQFPWRLFPEEFDVTKLTRAGRFFSNFDTAPPPILEAMVKEYIGKVFNNYRIVKLLGVGTTAMVFKAVHQTFHNEAAIKITFSIRDGFQKAKSVIIQGSNALRQLKHPNMVEIIDVGTQGEQIIFILMEYVKGARLDGLKMDITSRDSRGIDQLIRFGLQICEGLKAAHEFAFDTGEGIMQQGFVHGNLTPKKVMFSESGVLKLIDFAFADLSRTPGIQFDVPDEEEGSEIKIDRTQNKDFLPPEVQKGFAPVSKATDIYSIGAIFHWMVTGEASSRVIDYNETNVIKGFRQINPLLGDKLAQLTFKATHPDPKQRYIHLSEMAKDLKACLSEDMESLVAMDLAVAEDKEDFEGIKKKLLGKELHNFIIEKYLGTSLTSMVFSARNKKTDKVSALKISHRIISGYELAKKEVDKRTEILSYLNHRNINRVEQTGELGNGEYIYAIREFAQGKRLDKINFHIEDRKYFGIRNLINIFVNICEGVKAVHEVEFIALNGEIDYGVMHGNLSPKKIYVQAKGEVKVSDFLFGNFPHIKTLKFAIPEEVEKKYKDKNLLDYMPPEVLSVYERPTKRTDIYSLGAIFFEILTGRKLSQYIPETEYHLFRLMRQRNRKIPRRLSGTIFRAIHPDPYRRFNTVDELIRDLMKNTVFFSKVFYRFGHHGLD